MTTENPARRQLEDASNVLVLAPLTPAGNGTFLEILTAMSEPSGTNVAAITYTQPPNTWIEDWERRIGDPPGALSFIHANGAQVTPDEVGVPSASGGTTVLKVNPREPMDIIAPLTETLTRWRSNGRQTVVAVQTLSILLEYVDFDTAFRYLHVLTYRVQANAVGFYQMDPDVHDPEIVNTLKSLFDAVVEFDDDGWHVSETYSVRARVARDPSLQQPAERDPEIDSGVLGAISGVLGRFSGLGRAQGDEAAADDDAPAPTGEADDDAPADATSDDATGAAVLTDEERICKVLREYGGRMRQTAVTDELSWSKATVSRKLSAMEMDGIITRVRVGRENFVFLAGAEPVSPQSLEL